MSSDAIEINGLLIKGANQVLSFDKALELYGHNKDRPFSFQSLYQTISFLILTAGIVSSNQIYFGLNFLLAIPTKFECFKVDSLFEQMDQNFVSD